MKFHCLITLIASALFSCTSSPDVVHPELGIKVPEDWTGRKGEGPLTTDDWWQGFGDRELSELINEALQKNFDLLDALARVEEAVAEARIAGADLSPQVDFTLNAARSKQTFFGIEIPGHDDNFITSRFNRLETMFNLSWELDVWGRIRAGRESALANVEGSEADLRAVRQSLAAQICRTWFQLTEARQQLALASATADSFRTSSDWIRERYQQGVRPPLDLRLALSNLSGAEALVQRRRAELDQLTRQLEILLGRYPAGVIEAPGELPALASTAPAGLPANLLTRRPDVAFAERRLASSVALLEQARSALLPRISLTTGGGTASNELKNLVDPDFGIWSFGGNLVQPLLQGGRLLAGVDLAEAQRHRALAAYGKTVLRAYSEVETALSAEGFLAARETALVEAAKQSRGARQLAEEQYRAGLVEVLTLVESQRLELEAKSELLGVRRQRLETRVNLHLSLGGGFEDESDSETDA